MGVSESYRDIRYLGVGDDDWGVIGFIIEKKFFVS